MRGLIFDIRRFSVHDGPGIRTTVFMKGCPLSCLWCHNPESRRFRPEVTLKRRTLDDRDVSKPQTTGTWIESSDLIREITRDRIFFEESGGGVTFSGGEPLFQAGFLATVLKVCRAEGIHTAVDTSGYAPGDTLLNIASLTDLFLFDLKLLDRGEHKKFTGVSNKRIKENLKALFSSGKQIQLRFPVIPGITDTRANIEALIDFITKELRPVMTIPKSPATTNGSLSTGIITDPIRISLLPYHSAAREKYRRLNQANPLEHLPDLKPEALVPLQKELELAGLSVNIGS